MSATPPGVSTLSGNMGNMSFQEACVIGFLSYLRDASYDAVEPHTAFNYLTGARFALKCHHVDTTFVENQRP